LIGTPSGPVSRPLAGQVAVVTGAGNGIGAATAQRLLAEGCRVAALDLDADGLARTLRDAPPDHALALPGDCTEIAFVETALARVEREFGPVDILFNNVGQSARERGGPFHLSDEATWRFVLEVSLMTAMRFARRVAPGMRAREHGRIVNMSSDAAFAGDAGLVDYATAKMGLVGFTRSLARELAPHGVTVNAVAPGAVRTRAHDTLAPAVLDRIKAATPAGFVAEPEDVAGVVAFLAGPDARFVTGQTLLVDGGRWMI
jgi:NAD(P)-dependent dehydrogenase (short-subunit alcohol dehydrogenase family)